LEFLDSAGGIPGVHSCNYGAPFFHNILIGFNYNFNAGINRNFRITREKMKQHALVLPQARQALCEIVLRRSAWNKTRTQEAQGRKKHSKILQYDNSQA
jgi:hypothetical protein